LPDSLVEAAPVAVDPVDAPVDTPLDVVAAAELFFNSASSFFTRARSAAGARLTALAEARSPGDRCELCRRTRPVCQTAPRSEVRRRPRSVALPPRPAGWLSPSSANTRAISLASLGLGFWGIQSEIAHPGLGHVGEQFFALARQFFVADGVSPPASCSCALMRPSHALRSLAAWRRASGTSSPARRSSPWERRFPGECVQDSTAATSHADTKTDEAHEEQ